MDPAFIYNFTEVTFTVKYCISIESVVSIIRFFMGIFNLTQHLPFYTSYTDDSHTDVLCHLVHCMYCMSCGVFVDFHHIGVVFCFVITFISFPYDCLIFACYE